MYIWGCLAFWPVLERAWGSNGDDRVHGKVDCTGCWGCWADVGWGFEGVGNVAQRVVGGLAWMSFGGRVGGVNNKVVVVNLVAQRGNSLFPQSFALYSLYL